MRGQILREAWSSLLRNRVRSLLTLSGMAWGVSCFLLLLAYGDGFARALYLGQAYFGDRVSIIWNGQTSRQVGGMKAGRRIRMELADVEEIRKNASLIQRVSPEYFRNFPIRSPRRLSTDGVRGINHEYPAMRGHFIAEGRHLSAEDVQYARRVVVLGDGLRRKLFSEAPAVGQEIRISGIPFTVIGVLRKKVSMSNYYGPDDTNAFIPYTALAVLMPIRYLGVLVVQPVSLEAEEAALRQVRQILARRHRFDPDDPRALSIHSWRENFAVLQQVITGVRLFLLFMGALTLSIGGVGLMNIMLVAVQERTREIGLRKALGARRRHVLTQFLVETLFIALVGGVGGYLLAQGIGLVVGRLPFWSTMLNDPSGQADIQLIVSPQALLISTCTLSLVALLCGLLPALRAARMAPVEALRYE